MKKLLLLALLASCTCTEVIQTKSTANLPYSKSDGFTFENDTIKVMYSFWGEYGAMGICIYNKLNKPIYIDWGNSSFIENGNTINFWHDQSQSVSNTTSVGVSSRNNNTAVGVGKSQTNTTVFRPTRIVMIPPKSQITDASFRITNAPITNGTFDYNSSPIKFRGYLVLSIDQEAKNQFYVDEEFYVTDVKYIKTGPFQGGHSYTPTSTIYEYPFRRPDWFYINNVSAAYSNPLDPYKAYGSPVE